MPKRSRSGEVSRPARVVAPTSVNGGRSSLIERAAGPSPIMMSSWKSSIAGYSTSSTTGLRRWISSTNSTSRGCRFVSSAARSPGRSSTGPGGLPQVHAELVRDDVRERGLAEARRAEDQHVIERLAALARGLDEDLQLRLDRRLADVVGELLRAHGAVERLRPRPACLPIRCGPASLISPPLPATPGGSVLRSSAPTRRRP